MKRHNSCQLYYSVVYCITKETHNSSSEQDRIDRCKNKATSSSSRQAVSSTSDPYVQQGIFYPDIHDVTRRRGRFST